MSASQIVKEQQKRGWTGRPIWDRYPSAAAGCSRHWCAAGDSRRAGIGRRLVFGV